MSRRYRPRGLYLWLALLTLCAVFAATAGAREAVASRTQAVRQTLAATTPSTRTITASAGWSDVQSVLSFETPSQQLTEIPPATIDQVTRQLHDGFDHAPVSLAPVSADWSSLTVPFTPVEGSLPGTGATQVKIEVTERQPLGAQLRLLSGHLPAASGKPATLQVVMTKQTAATLGLHAGSSFVLPGTEQASSGAPTSVTVQVTGIVEPADAAASFWGIDPALLAAGLQYQGTPPSPYWAAGVIAGPDEAAALQSDFGSPNLRLEWVFPLDVSSVDAQQVQPLGDALHTIGSQTPALSGSLAPVATTLTVSSSMWFSLNLFIATAQSVDALLWLLYVSLTAAGLAVLLLAARMVAQRRTAEITVIRARGGSLWQVAAEAGRDAALLCVPAAVAGVVLAVLAVPGSGQGAGSPGGWWPPAAIVAVAVLGPALVAAWQHRLPRRQAALRSRQRAGARLVAEAALVAASVAGIVAFRDQGTQAGSGVNLYTSLAPVLVAIPAVIVVLRLYPLVLRELVRAVSATSRAPAFLGLARASRNTLTPALPAFALVLALTVAAFAGMVRDAVAGGEAAASWRTVGADATVTPAYTARGFTVPAAAARAVAAVPGVTRAAGVMNDTWTTPADDQVTVLAVDPGSYAALVARTQGFPPVPAGRLTAPAKPGEPQAVLASPRAVALLGAAGEGGAGVRLSTLQAPVRPVQVRVAGVIASTPALPAGGAFVIMPLAALTPAGPPAGTRASPPPAVVNELLLAGGSIDQARLATVVRNALPGGVITSRSDILNALAGGPLQHGAFTVFSLAVVLAAVLGLAVMLLELALGAPEREATLARLATMGLGERQRAQVVALEVLPAIIAAALAAWASALALPRVLAPDLDLSVFTGSAVTVQLAADVASFALPLAGLAVLAAVALGLEIRLSRRRAATSLRAGG